MRQHDMTSMTIIRTYYAAYSYRYPIRIRRKNFEASVTPDGETSKAHITRLSLNRNQGLLDSPAPENHDAWGYREVHALTKRLKGGKSGSDIIRIYGAKTVV